jgi:magnesium-transporting ATPase (P-type)
MGQIAGLAQESGSNEKTQFQQEVNTFIKLISVLAITIGELARHAVHAVCTLCALCTVRAVTLRCGLRKPAS